MKKIFSLLLLLNLGFQSLFAQLANGSIAPDFTLTDINGNQQNLYSYLNAGKTVYIDFFACHCPYCWNYHNAHFLSDLYDTYGPNTSTNDVFVMAIELDPNNGTDEFYGISGNTQGNWVEGTNYPQINPEGNNLTEITTNYNVVFYPMIYAICPDKTITLIGTQNTETLYNHVSTCATANIESVTSENDFEIVVSNEKLSIISSIDLSNEKIEIIDLQGKIQSQISNPNLSDISKLQSGMYFIRINTANKIIQKRFFLP